MAALWASSMSVKVGLLQGSTETEVRRLALPLGSATTMADFASLCESRFGVRLSTSAQYVDGDGDCVTLSTSAELKEALLSRVQKFSFAALADDDWEVLGEEAGTAAKLLVAESAVAEPAVEWQGAISFWVDEEKVTLQNPKPNVTLLDWLRESRGLHGTHQGCGEGGCGICTVALRLPSGETVPINSCLRRLCGVDGCHVVTTQGLGSVRNGLHPVQQGIADGNGSQCGFCTPGWVMNMYALLEQNAKPSAEEVEQHFDGNLCRCTGYRPILTAFGKFAEGGSCCGQHRSVPAPAELLSHVAQPLHFSDAETGEEWFRPVDLEQLQTAQAAAAKAQKALRYICAGTADGVAKYLQPASRTADGTVFIDVSALSDLKELTFDSSALTAGSTVPIAKLIEALEANGGADPAFQHYAEHMKRVASVQIRAVGSWAGNLMLCRESARDPEMTYFPSDLLLVLATAGATLNVTSGGKPSVIGVMDLLTHEGDLFVESVQIPVSPAGALVRTYKQMQRHVFTHAIVHLGLNAVFKADKSIEAARIVVGGATAQTILAKKAAQSLVGKKLTQQTLTAALAALAADIQQQPSEDPLQAQSYREDVAAGFLYKWFLDGIAAQGGLPASLKSALVPFVPADARPVSSGKEDFGTDPTQAPFTTYVPKIEARIQASGEALYSSDIALGALFGQLVFSTRGSKLTGLDASAALAMPGVRDFVVAGDVPGVNNSRGDPSQSPAWKIFYEVGDDLPHVGSPLGLIVADTWAQARRAAKNVVQKYASSTAVVKPEVALRLGHASTPAQIRHALADPKRMGMRRSLPQFDPRVSAEATTREEADQSVSGDFHTGGQSHLYLETQSAVVVPKEGDLFEVFNSGQDRLRGQSAVAVALGLPGNKILMHNTRCGGGFGGKISYQTVFLTAVAVAAYKLRRPIRLQNERSDDMQMMGSRHPISFKYTATFDAEGTLDALKLLGTADAGWTGAGYGQAAASLCDNNYRWNSYTPTGKDAFTAKPANTAMRAPPTMQAALAGEVILEHVAKTLNMDLDEVMEKNFLKMGDTTQQGNKIGTDTMNFTVPELWAQIQSDSKYKDRKAAVKAYNAANRWTKKGISLTSSRWDFPGPGNAYALGAHVSIFADGSVMVSSGGVEIGQGLNTKVAMAVAHAFGIDLSTISVGDGDSNVLPNSGTTGGSGTSECCVFATQQACEVLKKRLEPFLAKVDQDWQKAVGAAVAAGVDLGATGWNTGAWDKSDGKTNNVAYAVYGACVSEVMVDVLTGDIRLERVDVLMDLGSQLNAAVDLGQVQGGYVMALGYLFSEQQQWDSAGKLLNQGTWEYKIPTAYDIPVEFNVALLKDSPNPNGVQGSKAVAEPAMHLIAGPFLAAKNAIYAARTEVGHKDEWIPLNVPVTPEAIRTAIDVPADQLKLP